MNPDVFSMSKSGARNFFLRIFQPCYENRSPLQERALPFLNIDMSRKCHDWVQGYQTLEKQHRNGRGGGAENRDLVGSAPAKCESYIPVLGGLASERTDCNLSRSIGLTLLKPTPKLFACRNVINKLQSQL